MSLGRETEGELALCPGTGRGPVGFGSCVGSYFEGGGRSGGGTALGPSFCEKVRDLLLRDFGVAGHPKEVSRRDQAQGREGVVDGSDGGLVKFGVGFA